MKKSSKVVWVLILLPLIFCCGGVGFIWWRLTRGPSGLAAAAARYRRTGLPWTADEVGPRVAPADNAAPLLRRAIPYFKSASRDAADLRKDMDAGELAQAGTILERYDRSLELVRRAADKSGLDFGYDWDLGPMAMFPELAPLKGMVNVLVLRAEYDAATGNRSASNHDLLAAWRLGNLAGKLPILIGMLVQLACDRIVLTAANHCADVQNASAGDLRVLASTVDRMMTDPDFELAMRGEAYLGLSVVRNLNLYPIRTLSGDGGELPQIDPRQLKRSGMPCGFMASIIGGPVLEGAAEREEIIQRDHTNMDAMSADLAELDRRIEAAKRPQDILRLILDPVYNQSVQAIIVMEAQRLALRAFLRGMVIRARSGRFPERIDQIPGRWVDPFDGKPLRVISKTHSFRVYSVGPDKVDNSGLTRGEIATDSSQYDIPASYPPVKRQAR